MSEDFTNIESIRATAKNFSLDGAQDEVVQTINAMSGLDSGTSDAPADEAVNGEESLSAAEAVNIVKLRKSAPWERIEAGIRTLLEQFQGVADNEKLSHDARMTAADKILGVKAVQALVGGIFAAANETVASLTKDDVLKLGDDYKTARAATRPAAPAPLQDVPTNPRHFTSEEIAENTARAEAFLKTLPKRAN